jgi:hypothetical protein
VTILYLTNRQALADKLTKIVEEFNGLTNTLVLKNTFNFEVIRKQYPISDNVKAFEHLKLGSNKVVQSFDHLANKLISALMEWVIQEYQNLGTFKYSGKYKYLALLMKNEILNAQKRTKFEDIIIQFAINVIETHINFLSHSAMSDQFLCSAKKSFYFSLREVYEEENNIPPEERFFLDKIHNDDEKEESIEQRLSNLDKIQDDDKKKESTRSTKQKIQALGKEVAGMAKEAYKARKRKAIYNDSDNLINTKGENTLIGEKFKIKKTLKNLHLLNDIIGQEKKGITNPNNIPVSNLSSLTDGVLLKINSECDYIREIKGMDAQSEISNGVGDEKSESSDSMIIDYSNLEGESNNDSPFY